MIGSGIFFVAMSSEMFYTPKTNLDDYYCNCRLLILNMEYAVVFCGLG